MSYIIQILQSHSPRYHLQFTEIQNARHAWTSLFFVGAKTQKLKSEICASDFTEI